MTYLKVTNKQETHHGLHYKTGLNIDPKRFRAEGHCVAGGIYFSSEAYILAFLSYGIYVREVTIPKRARMVQIPAVDTKWRASRVILGPRKDLRKVKTWEWLIQLGVYIPNYDRYVLSFLVQDGNPETFKYITDKFPGLLKSPSLVEDLWKIALESDRVDILKLLPQSQVSIDCHFEYALKWGRIATLEYLLSLGVRLRQEHLVICAEHNSLKKIQWLLDKGLKISTRPEALWYAMMFTNKETFDLLLANGLTTHRVLRKTLVRAYVRKRHLKEYLTKAGFKP